MAITGAQRGSTVTLKKYLTGDDGEYQARRFAAGGLFGHYLGYAPIFKKAPNVDDGLSASLIKDGKGEYGRLLTMYQWNSMREAKGYAELDSAVWEKRIWDDTGSWFKAPTIKGVIDMGVTIAAMVITAPMGGIGGALISAGINLADDAVFTALDVASGHKKWQEAGLDFGKKVLSSAVNVAVTGAFSGFSGEMVKTVDDLGNTVVKETTTGIFGKVGGLMGKVQGSGFGSVLAKTAIVGAQTMTSSLASGLINSWNLNYDKNGNITGLGWSNDAFAASVGGGITSSLAGMASTFTSGTLGLLDMYGRNSGLLNKDLYNLDSIGRFNGFIGSLTGQAVTYALSGNASFNVFNLADLTGGEISGGLLELGISKDGISGRIGAGGADISYGMLVASAAGFLDATKVLGAKALSLFGDMRAISTIDSTNMLSYNGGRDLELARRIKTGNLKVKYGKIEGGGNYSLDTGEITITDELLGGDAQTSAMLAAMMSHEGTHAEGIRIEAEAHANAYTSYQNIMGNYNMEADGLFTGMMLLGMADPANIETNTGNEDWWKLQFSGGRVKLVWDKISNELELPDGTKIKTDLKGEKKDEMSASLLAELFLSDKSADQKKEFAKMIRGLFGAGGLSLVKEDGIDQWRARTGDHDLVKPLEEFYVDITDSFDSLWSVMGGKDRAIAKWVEGGARGIGNDEVGYRTDSFFVSARMPQVKQEMKRDVVRDSTKAVDWKSTIEKFGSIEQDYQHDSVRFSIQGSGGSPYLSRLYELRASAYGLIGSLGSPAGPGGRILGVTQPHGDQATVEYVWREKKGGESFHPGTDFDMNGENVFAGLRGRIADAPSLTASTFYETVGLFDTAFNIRTDDKLFWHKGDLRHDDQTSRVTIDIGFQFGDTWVSSGLRASYYHMDSIPKSLKPGIMVGPSTILGVAGDLGRADGPHLDLTLLRPFSSPPSLFEDVFGLKAFRPWNTSMNDNKGALNYWVYVNPEWMKLFSKPRR